MGLTLRIGGAPAVTLQPQEPVDGPGFLEATLLPGRGMMLLQARLRLPSGREVDAIHAPALDEAARMLDGGPDDFAGNGSFSFGGAILAPFANRIRGRALHSSREIETRISGRTVRLPRNWGGQAPGAEQYAMHGLILDRPFSVSPPQPGRLAGWLEAGDFGGRWPSRTRLHIEWRLAAGELRLSVEARNTGEEPLPIGLGWHPYFVLPSGERRQARLHLEAQSRVEVNDYDEVLPTGRLLPTAGTPYDFGMARSVALGDLYLDDCFTELKRQGGNVIVEVLDPRAGAGLRIASSSAGVRAVQVYAPPTEGYVVVEPQYNLADPFGEAWPKEIDTGMVWLQPGEGAIYEVRVSVFPTADAG